MTALLLLLATLQGPPPALEITVDQDHIAVGEELVYSARAVSRSIEPMQVTIAPITGFQVISRMERSEVSSTGAPIRRTVLEVRLRAIRPGRWPLGPAQVRQGTHTVEADVVTVDVDPNRNINTVALNPRIRRLLERAPPPPYGKPGVSLIVSDEAVRVGEQVDVVTAAWFPRDLRVQLRRPPTLQPPVVNGVWTYPQASPTGIAATRTIRGLTYDLFVAHQIIFPLVAGTISIPSATLRYNTPLSLQLFSPEQHFALTSAPTTLLVRPLPTTDRPADFASAVGARLRLERYVTPLPARVGQTIVVEYTLSGDGNTTLWPAPTVRWPPTIRAYAERVEETVATVDGRLGGRKTFRYLVVPDSVGMLRLPGVTYPYFDLAADRYLSTAVAPAVLSVTSVEEAAASAALPPPLLAAGGPAWSWRLAHDVPDWAWLLILALPPLVIFFYARRPGRRRPAAPSPTGDSLPAAEERFEAVIQSLVPEPTRRSDHTLGAALRAAGVDAETTARVIAVRERILAARYAPGDRDHDPRLIADIDELVQRLAGSSSPWSRPATVLLVLALLAPVGRASAQAPSPEHLYDTGALHAAAESFANRAAMEPAVAAHWYNLGAAYYRLGLKGRAAAAWVRARRLDPRDPAVRRALQLTPPLDAVSARWTWVPPVRPEELLLAGLCGWLIAWFGWVGRPRARDRWAVLLVFSAAAVLAGLALRSWYRRPVAMVLEPTQLRLSPHGRAPELARLESGGAVLVLHERLGWVLVRIPDRRQGWLPADAIAVVGG